MDWFIIFKYIHIICAIAWLGGGLGLVVLGAVNERARAETDMLSTIKAITVLAPRVFIPGSVIVLLTGLAMVFFGGLTWDFWVVFGIVSILVTAGVGSAYLGPLAEKIMKVIAEPGGISEAQGLARRLLAVAKADYVLQFAIVYAMVAKPTWSDTTSIIVMLLLVVVSGGYFLAQGRKPQT